MRICRTILVFLFSGFVALAGAMAGQPAKPKVININPPHISTDKSVKYDYDIVYVRAPRYGDEPKKNIRWTEVFAPLVGERGSDLVLLHPDGREEVLVAAGDDAITDPFVSFDGESVYYARFHNVGKPGSPGFTRMGSDIFRIHVKTKKVVQLTHQEFTPNTGVVAGKPRPQFGVFNLGPCPLPGGKVMFTSDRNGFVPTKGYTPVALQLFVMDDDGSNVEFIGALNINSALHPTILRDGRVMFTSYESQGLRDLRMWGLWSIHPDGSYWEPLVSAFPFEGDTVFHFMTQLSDGHIVVEEYYNLNNFGFGTFHIFPDKIPSGASAFGPGYRLDRRNPGGPRGGMAFTPFGMRSLTTFASAFDSPARLSDKGNPNSPRIGKVTHPSAAPDNHLLTVWSPGGVNRNGSYEDKNRVANDSGIYLIKGGKPIREPGQMLLIKNDPKFNEQWPRALVPYQRIHGIDEPPRLPPLANDGKASPHLPEGTPFGLVGTSSLYKRESYPNGAVRPGTVTAAYAGGNDPFQGLGSLAYEAMGGNWDLQGADAGRYSNSDIHAIRIVVQEPTTNPHYGGRPARRWWNAGNERLRILGEIPVRKFGEPTGGQPKDPDGNPDTSFLAKIPADVSFTFQTLDRNGMLLNMAQTWHQSRPGEIRHDCGGCHAHSQKPTLFKDTAAAKADYVPFDLTRQTPLLTSKQHDQSGKKWDAKDETGLRFAKVALDVEFFRDVKPILDRSCAACHTQKGDKPAGNLVLDDDQLTKLRDNIGGGKVDGPLGPVPGTYARLVIDPNGRFGHPSPVGNWAWPQASRYVRLFQSRRSLLIWKVFGKRTDGWSNDDFACEKTPGDPFHVVVKGRTVPNNPKDRGKHVNLSYRGSIMPPPEAVAGTYDGPDGKKIKVDPLTDEDRLTLVRWIDLGCPIDLDFDPAHPEKRGHGWLEDETRPTLTLTYPRAGANESLTRFLVGMDDYYTGLDVKSFQVLADFAVDGVPAGRNLAAKFKALPKSRWELQLTKPITELAKGKLTVSVKDREGNITRIERTFSVCQRPASRK